jgi:hypothetical protein
MKFLNMKSLNFGIILIIFASCTAKNKLTGDEIVAIAREAYIYAMPLVYTDVTRMLSPVADNTLNHFRAFPDHTFRHVVAPNNDTNYSTAFLELGDEPVVAELPDTEGRYYTFPLLDAWTNNFFLPGKRTTGTGAQKYLITGPRWKGDIPAGLAHIQSPTELVWIIGRIQVNSPEDQAKFVTHLQDKFVLKPLSEWLTGAKPDKAKHRQYAHILPDSAQAQSVVHIVQNLSTEDFFNYANALLADNPPAPADSLIARRIAAIGVGAGKTFSLSAFDKETQEALAEVPADVYRALNHPDKDALFGKNTTDPAAKLGDYQTDYNYRARVAYAGLGALPPEEAVYYSYYAAADGTPLHGKHSYRIHFNKGQLPPAEAFWSYTVYDKDRYLVENPIRRYAIGDRNPLAFNRDGSLDLYLANESPGANRENNWLPTGSDTFNVTLRIYIPTEAFLKDRSIWSDPKITINDK